MTTALGTTTQMTAGSLKVVAVSKQYETYNSEWSRVLGWFGIASAPKSAATVLHDISFTVSPGEAVGIIGQNGSGKSTLLKIVTGTLAPSQGFVERHGRIAALLELGLGFNADFTGAENAENYLRMIGLAPEHVVGLMPRVEEFAEIGDYFREPVRTYSSGMQMRVAFAAATALRPDVLIVDEALAVGDSYFVHKCMARIREFCSQGTTLLFVSHSPDAVRELCDRGILLDKGRLLKDGPPDEVADYYNALIAAKENEKLTIEQRRNKEGWLSSHSGSGEVVTESVQLTDGTTGNPIKLVIAGQLLRVVASFRVNAVIPSLVVGIMLRDKLGHVVWGCNTWHTKQTLISPPLGRHSVSLSFPCELGAGSYGISVALHKTDVHVGGNFQWQDNVVVFDVMLPSDMPTSIGTSLLRAKFEIDLSPSLEPAPELALAPAPVSEVAP